MNEADENLPACFDKARSKSTPRRWKHARRSNPTEESSVTRRRECDPPTAAEEKRPARYLINEEAAAHVRLSPRTLEKMRVQGGGPRFRKLGRRVVYLLDDLDSWTDARACAMTSDPQYSNTR